MDFDFSKNTQLDALDAVPPDVKPFYKQVDGKFALDSENPAVNSAVAMITKMNASLKAARNDANTLKSKVVDLTPLSEFGSNPEEIQQNVQAKLKELQDSVGKDAKVNLDKIKADLAAGHAKDSEIKDKKIGALTNQLYGLMVESSATGALAEAKGNVKLLMPFIKEQVKVVEEDGEFKVFVVDKANERRYSGTTGAPMTIKELVLELKANGDFAGAFASEKASGGGTPPGGANRPNNAGGAGTQAGGNSTSKIAAGLAKRG